MYLWLCYFVYIYLKVTCLTHLSLIYTLILLCIENSLSLMQSLLLGYCSTVTFFVTCSLQLWYPLILLIQVLYVCQENIQVLRLYIPLLVLGL